MTITPRLLRHAPALLSTVALVGAVACGGGGEEADGDYDPALLESYRSAIPSPEVMEATTPDGMGTSEMGLAEQALVGEPAIYPQSARPVAAGINGAIKDVVVTMRAIFEVPPTFYNADSGEFLWGPWPNEDGVGQAAAYIVDNGEAADFRYSYALIRIPPGEGLEAGTPVIWGASNPDPADESLGSGVVLWDFEANRTFEDAHNPEHGVLPQGRFAAVYARAMEGEDRVTWVLSAFRGFVGEEDPDAEPANLDYFHGEYLTPEHSLRWLNYAGEVDITDGDDVAANDAPSAPEDLDVRMVFVDRGQGRAEVVATGGDLDSDPEVDAVASAECWDDSSTQVWFGLTALDAGGERLWSQEDGERADCGPLFEVELSELDVPTLDQVDPELRAAVGEVAENGVQPE